MFRRALPLVLLFVTAACGADSPTTPTQPATPTRIISITGNLSFGEVDLDSTAERTAQIANTGTEALTVTGMNGPQGFSASWTNGMIPAGGSQSVVFRFSPTERRDYAGSVVVAANHTAGNNRIDINGTGRQSGPRIKFGAGHHRVGADIAPGRYFTAVTAGCYWERQSGLGGTFGEIIANDFVGYTSPQYIVDILGSDVGFETDSECGTWDHLQRGGSRTTIPSGIWLVGAQVAPGTYRTSAPAGCYWERLRHFEHRGVSGVIANDFIPDAGQQLVTIGAGDTGFQSDDCGTWERVSGTSTSALTPYGATGSIEANWTSWRHRKGVR